MIVVLDSSVLLRLTDSSDPKHSLSADAIAELAASGHELRLLPQVIYEFWVVATRTKAANGLEIAADEASRLIDGFTARMLVHHDNEQVYESWRRLTGKYQVKGVPNHDLRIVAAMVAHSVPALLTLNSAHFRRWAEITVIEPNEVAAWVQQQPGEPL